MLRRKSIRPSRNFFEPVFMVQPAENILRSYLAVATSAEKIES